MEQTYGLERNRAKNRSRSLGYLVIGLCALVHIFCERWECLRIVLDFVRQGRQVNPVVQSANDRYSSRCFTQLDLYEKLPCC